MGRPRKPNGLKVLDGDRKDRITQEPSSPEGLGECPGWFDDHARAAWGRLVTALEPMGIATQSDREAASIFCQSYSTWRQALDVINHHGMLVTSKTEMKTRTGSLVKEVFKANPLLPAMREAQKQMMVCLAHFGMTPSARSALHVQGKTEDDPFAKFLAKAKGQSQSQGKKA